LVLGCVYLKLFFESDTDTRITILVHF